MTRTWSLDGHTIVGTAPDQPDEVWRLIPAPGVDQGEALAAAQHLVAAGNRAARLKLTPEARREEIVTALITYQMETGRAATVRDIATTIGCSTTTVQSDLRQLATVGRIQFADRGPTGRRPAAAIRVLDPVASMPVQTTGETQS